MAEADAAELQPQHANEPPASRGRMRPPRACRTARAERVREHRARTQGDLRAVRDRAVDGHQPRRRRHDGAHLVEAEEDRARGRAARCSSMQPDGLTLKCRFVSGSRDRAAAEHRRSRVGQGLAGWVARNRRTLVNADPRLTFDALRACRQITACSPRSSARSPSNDTFIGCLTLFHTQPNRYTEDHRRLLERVAEQAGPVIHNSIVFEQTQEDSLTDPLTSLPNRRSMFAHLARELVARRASRARARRSSSWTSTSSSDQRHLRPPRRRPRAARSRRSAPERAAVVRPVRALRGRRVHHRPRGCSREAVEAKRRELQERVGRDRDRGPRRQDAAPRRPAPAPRCSPTTARATKRSSPKPTTACTATRPPAAPPPRESRAPWPEFMLTSVYEPVRSAARRDVRSVRLQADLGRPAKADTDASNHASDREKLGAACPSRPISSRAGASTSTGRSVWTRAM